MRLRISGLTGDQNFAGNFGANLTTIFINFAWSKTAALTAAATASHKFRLFDGATVQCSFTMDENGNIRVFRGDVATLLGTYVAAYPGAGGWNHFQVKIVIDDVAGSFEIRRDGSTSNDFAVTGVDTKTTANAFATSIDCACGSNNPDVYLIDDVWIFDDGVVTGEPSNWIGDARAVQIMPTSDSSVTLSRSAGATNFSNVDELIQSATDYVFGAAAGLVDEYGQPGFGANPPAVILGVTEKVAALKTDAGPRTIGTRTRSGATVQDSAGRTLTSAVINYPFNVDLNPNTGASWTAAELAAMTFGPRIVT